MKKFWNFVRNADNVPVLYLYGPISETSWFGDEVTPKAFLADLEAHTDAHELHIRINSPGGDVFAATTIFSNLMDTGKRITATVDGLCASAATIPLMAADTRRGRPGTMVMIHKPETGVWGNADDMKDTIGILDTVQKGIVEAYARTGLDEKKLNKMMDDVTWMSGREAFANGFLTEIVEDDHGAVHNCAAFSFSSAALLRHPAPNANGAVLTPQPVTDHSGFRLRLMNLRLKLDEDERRTT